LQARNGKLTKAPINPRTGALTSISDPSVWSNFNLAKIGRDRFGCDGLGFVLNGDGLVAIDLDDCVKWDDQNPRFDNQAGAIIRALGSYAEFSPSRNGIHILAFGDLPLANRRNEAARVEIYSRKQYLTVTGDLVPGSSVSICNRQLQLRALLNQFFPGEARDFSQGRASEYRRDPRTTPTPLRVLDDDSLLMRARSAKNGTRFRTLFDDGTACEYSSDSEADLALCLILAFWTGRDGDRIDRLFRRSARMREKWEREDYRTRTIDRALNRVQSTWKPRIY